MIRAAISSAYLTWVASSPMKMLIAGKDVAIRSGWIPVVPAVLVVVLVMGPVSSQPRAPMGFAQRPVSVAKSVNGIAVVKALPQRRLLSVILPIVIKRI